MSIGAHQNFVRMQEHVTNCRTSAQHAVASLLAPDTMDEYDYLPFFYSRVFNLSWQARQSPFRVFGSPPCAGERRARVEGSF